MLLHGLTATRRYVVMGSSALERSGHRVVAYDARGHGASAPAPRPDAYGYDDLADDLRRCSTSSGSSARCSPAPRWARTRSLRLALERPERVAALVVITPGVRPRDAATTGLARWDALAEGLRDGRDRGLRRRRTATRMPGAVARHGAQRPAPAPGAARAPRRRRRRAAGRPALAPVRVARRPRRASRCPTVVVASRDEADPGHPLASARPTPPRSPARELRHRGARQVPARLAGRPALQGHRRLAGSVGPLRSVPSRGFPNVARGSSERRE